MKLRDYQQRTLDQLYDWFSKSSGNPCVVLPTGAGKSHVIAALCKDAVQNWPETRILMLTHVKELIEQNAEKMRQHWPGAPMGIYSASLGRKQLDEPITFAGIQSIRTKSKQIGHVDLVIIDECFVAGTKISTPKGLVDIDKLSCGDLVFNQCGLGVVEAISSRSSEEIYLIELDDERNIECTGNHPFFTENGWQEAKLLANGSYLFGIQDMSELWERVPSLDENFGEWKSSFCNAGTCMEKANLLLGGLCEEIKSDCFECSSKEENKQYTEGDKAQTYSERRKRAIAVFASIGASSCFRGGMGSRACNKDKCGSFKRGLSKCLQSGHWEQGDDDSNRVRRGFSRLNRKAESGQEKIGFLKGARVVSVSRVKRESATPVFNLQVSGHPSYFANGVAVHNCHLVNHKAEGGYRTLLHELKEINPALKIVGLTATPWRLGHGLITDKPAIFDDLLEPVGIEELIHKGYLATLRSKVTTARLNVSGVHKKGGEYIESELQAAVDTDDNNYAVVEEVIRLAEDRKAWLFFCAGVQHATHVAECLRINGVTAEVVTGETPKTERERILSEFKAGKIMALTNANILTTGFDYPDIDLIAMLRPTMSPSLYVQMAGRGMRIKSDTDHCLVLDFAGVVEQHGPVTAVQPPRKAGDGDGDAPVKVCKKCNELCHISAKECPVCHELFPEPEKKLLVLRDDDIMGLEAIEMEVTGWNWRKHISRTSGNEMVACTYYGALSDRPITEYFPILNSGYAGSKAISQISMIAHSAGAVLDHTLDGIVNNMNSGSPPGLIQYRMDGKFHRVMGRSW